MDPIYLLLGLLLVILIVGIFIIYRKLSDSDGEKDDRTIDLLQRQINELTRMQNEKLDRTIKDLNDRLSEQNKTLNDQLGRSHTSLQQQFAISQKNIKDANDQSSKIMKELTEELANVKNTNKQVVGFAEQMQSLENILKNPKQRGVLGEYFLETILRNVLPPNGFEMQYKFENGEIVDAVVRAKDGIIPIDAKFSLENYNKMARSQDPAERDSFEKMFKQDLKKRIDETSKYVRPEEGTLGFAFMFIPADGLYAVLQEQRVGGLEVNQADLIEYAFGKRVLIVSPSMLFAYLQTVLHGLRSLQIEQQTKQIIKHVENLHKHMRAYEEHLSRLGGHLEKSLSSYDKASKEFGKIDKDVIKITGGESIVMESEQVENPTLSFED